MAMQPRGEERADYHAAQVCTTVMQTVSSIFAKKGTVPKSIPLSDCLLKFKEPESLKSEKDKLMEKETAKYQMAIAMAGMFGKDAVPGLVDAARKHAASIKGLDKGDD